ncbi:MAG: class I SAM-dependent methyltransferase [Candidatus Eiseniibacteriota bacterium]
MAPLIFPMIDYLDGTVDFDDPRVVSAFDEATLWSSRFGTLLLDHLPMAGGRRILDLGCGTGFPLFELANRHGRSCRLVGVDVWGAALRRAAAKREAYGLSRVALVRGDGARLPFADRAFDVVVSNLGVNNFADPAPAVGECARVSKRGAVFALTTNPRGCMAELYDSFRETLRAAGSAALIAALDGQEAHRLVLPDLRRMLESAGFALERVVEDELRIRAVDGGAFLRHTLIRFGFLDGWRGVVPAERQQAVFAALEAKLDERARTDGELTFHVPMLYLEARRT